MAFGTFLDEAGLWLDSVHFPPSLKATPFRGPGIYVIEGKVMDEFDFLSIEVIKLTRLENVNRE